MQHSVKNIFIGLMCVVALTLAGVQNVAAEDNKEDSVFYVLGVALSQGLASFSLSDSELNEVVTGLKDALNGKADDVNVREHATKLQTLRQEREAAVAAAEKQKSVAFLASAAGKKGATQYDSGLVMTVVEEGSGASPVETDTVKVHYHGTFHDGSVFDSSVDRGTPATFALNRVIPCWTEGVGMMKVGGKSQLVCPSDIAYGDGGRPGSIPGGATLVFDVELIEIVAAPN